MLVSGGGLLSDGQDGKLAIELFGTVTCMGSYIYDAIVQGPLLGAARVSCLAWEKVAAPNLKGRSLEDGPSGVGLRARRGRVSAWGSAG